MNYIIQHQVYITSAYIQDSSGAKKLVYTDRAGDAVGVVEIKGDSFPTSRPTKVASSFTLRSTWYYSNNLSGSAEQNLTSRAHTIAIYTTNFSGEIAVEGNLDDTASVNDDDWFVIPINGMGAVSTTFTPASADPKIDPYQFNTAVRWIRVKYKPAGGNAGTFDQMLLRN